MANTFGSMLRELRAKQRIPLRRFCVTGGFDPVEVSRIERGEIAPPKEEKVLARYLRTLKIPRTSRTRTRFFTLAKTAKGRIATKSKAEILQQLPAVFRTTKGRKVDSHTLDRLVEKIKTS